MSRWTSSLFQLQLIARSEGLLFFRLFGTWSGFWGLYSFKPLKAFLPACQVLKLSLSLPLLASACYFGYLYCLNPLLLQSGWYEVKSVMTSPFSDKMHVSQSFWQTISHEKLSSTQTVSIKRLQYLIKPYLMVLKIEGSRLATQTLYAGLISLGSILLFFLIRGTASKRKKYVDGKMLISPFRLSCRLRLKRKASDFKLSSLPLIKGTETQHILVTGGTGSGKTNCFHHLLPQIRSKKQKAVIIDTSGTFIERYYNPATDVILNPFDPRGAAWHPWAECLDQFDYEAIAESFIPHSNHDSDNYWRTAARCLLSSLLQKTKDTQRTSELALWLLFKPLTDLAAFVQGTSSSHRYQLRTNSSFYQIRSFIFLRMYRTHSRYQ